MPCLPVLSSVYYRSSKQSITDLAAATTKMAFFGLTTLGPKDPIKELMASKMTYVFHEIPYDRYMECFDKYLLGESPTALTLEVDGDNYILRASLGDMCRELLGRQPRKFELDAWFTHCDFDRSAAMSREEFIKAITNLHEFCAKPQLPKQYDSYDQLRTDWLRSTRVEYERQRTCKVPMTAAQEYGWHALKPRPPHHPHHVNHTDVTKGEGRTASTYYGYFVVGQ